MRTLFLRLFPENRPSLWPVIIRAAYRSAKQFVGLQGNSTIKPLFNQKTEKSSFADFFTWFYIKWPDLIGLRWKVDFCQIAWYFCLMRTTAKLIQTPHFCPWEKKARTQFSLNSAPLIWTLSSHSNLFSRTLPVATFWTYKRKTVCFLHSLHFDPKDF